MKKRELLERIEQLEQRVQELETRQVQPYQPVWVAPHTTPGYTPWWLQGSVTAAGSQGFAGLPYEHMPH